MSVTVNNSPNQVYSCMYNFTQLIMLNLLWNDHSWIQTLYRFILYKLPHFLVRIILKRWMLWTSKFLHFPYRIIHVVLSKYVVTILVSTDFAWWLPLTGLSWLPYAFAVLLVLWLHLLQAQFPTLIYCWWVEKLFCTRACFLSAIQAI